METLRYPIGKFSAPPSVSKEDIQGWIQTIEQIPSQMREAVKNLDDAQLDTPYRDGGWTIRQVVHHVPDSHMNAYIRFKLALTEDNPAIRPYLEDRWAELPDSKSAPVGTSLDLLEAIHKRWVLVLRNMSATDFKRTFFHPENKVTRSLEIVLSLYDWHSRHHLAHITSLKEIRGWI
ncbi:MAG: YfiT family bacillithiol transferase [Bacteroidota bacterium]